MSLRFKLLFLLCACVHMYMCTKKTEHVHVYMYIYPGAMRSLEKDWYIHKKIDNLDYIFF